MPVRLSIEMISPLTEDDRDLLAGLAVMTVAIANREMAQHPPEQTTCGEFEYEPDADRDGGLVATGRVCVSDPKHLGRHKFRATEFTGLN